DDEPDFVARAVTDKRSVHLYFDFPNLALGRGAGDNVGAVELVSLTFKREDAISIANLLLEVASSDGNLSQERFFGSVSAESREFWRRFKKWRRDNPEAPLSDFSNDAA